MGPVVANWREARVSKSVSKNGSESLPPAGPYFLRYSISFFSSIILSSRPTVSRWNSSSSVSRSSSQACCSAISGGA